MKHIFYEDWYKKRLTKIISIFGENWFHRKRILELGSCHGDIGINFLKLGSNVLFTDVREEHLEGIKTELLKVGFMPDTKVLDQNQDYDLHEQFDLILHLGTLYHVENWRNDLKCSLSHTNLMILESMITPVKNAPDSYNSDWEGFNYGTYGCKNALFTQEAVESELLNLGCKFIRFDDPNLNSEGWLLNDMYFKHIYDWTYESVEAGVYDQQCVNHFRRMWLILK